MFQTPSYPKITVREFLEFDFVDRRVELDDGVIRVLSGGTVWHCTVQGNIIAALVPRVKGSGWRAYMSSLAIQTSDSSIRHPDITIHDERDRRYREDDLAVDRPAVIFEIHSAGTARTNLNTKLDEYKAMPSVETIVLVDIAAERLRTVQRIAPQGWTDVSFQEPTDLSFPSIGIAIGHEEIFARD